MPDPILNPASERTAQELKAAGTVRTDAAPYGRDAYGNPRENPLANRYLPDAGAPAPRTETDILSEKIQKEGQAESPEALHQRISGMFSEEIAAIQKNYANLFEEQTRVNVAEAGRARALTASTGLLGTSDFGTAILNAQDEAGMRKLGLLTAQENLELSRVYTTAATAEQKAFEEERTAMTKADQARLDYLTGKITTIQGQIAASAFVPYDDLLKDQDKYNALFKASGMADPVMFETFWKGAYEAFQIGLKPRGSAAGGWFFPHVGPDGTVSYGVKNADGTLSPDVRGVTPKTTQERNYEYAVSQGETRSFNDWLKAQRRQPSALDVKLKETRIAAADVMIASRRTTIVNNTLKALYGSTQKSPLAIYNNSAQVVNRVNVALREVFDKGVVARNVPDLDLIDAYVQIARGGQAITEAQVEVLLRGLGITAKFNVGLQKITGSATLDDPTREELGRLTKGIYEEQGKSADAAIPHINDQLRANGIPENMLFKRPEDITGILPESQNKLDQATFESLSAQLDSGEVLATDADGNIVAATQDEIDSGDYTPINQ